jgi:hypothetical protein
MQNPQKIYHLYRNIDKSHITKTANIHIIPNLFLRYSIQEENIFTYERSFDKFCFMHTGLQLCIYLAYSYKLLVNNFKIITIFNIYLKNY